MVVPFINTQTFINRIADIFENNSSLFPVETNDTRLITAVLRNKPPIEQSSPESITPYILVFESDQPLRVIEKAGRDGRNTQGGEVHEVEIYCVAVTNAELTTELAQVKLSTITTAMRSALSQNLRLANPEDKTDDPLCRSLSYFQINYNLSGTTPKTMRAANVVIRAQVYVSPLTVS